MGFAVTSAKETEKTAGNPIRVIFYCSNWALSIWANYNLIEEVAGVMRHGRTDHKRYFR
jgi:hypothetical protein